MGEEIMVSMDLWHRIYAVVLDKGPQSIIDDMDKRKNEYDEEQNRISEDERR